MFRAMSVACVGLLALVLLAGCASSADVARISDKLDTLEEKVTADLKVSSKSVEETEKSVAAADARLKTVEEQLADKTSALEAGLGNMQRSLKTIADDMEKVQSEMAAFRSTIDTQLAAMTKRAAKTEADAAAAAKQLPTVQAEIAEFKLQFKQMNASIKEAQVLILKNLENARDIYKTQFLALEEVLQQMKKAEKPAPTPPPK